MGGSKRAPPCYLQPELEQLVLLEVCELPLRVHLAARLQLNVGSTLIGTIDLGRHEQLHPSEAQAEHLQRVRAGVRGRVGGGASRSGLWLGSGLGFGVRVPGEEGEVSEGSASRGQGLGPC